MVLLLRVVSMVFLLLLQIPMLYSLVMHVGRQRNIKNGARFQNSFGLESSCNVSASKSYTKLFSSMDSDSVGDLSTALAVLDSRWQNDNKKSRWEKVDLNGEDSARKYEEYVYLLKPPEQFLRPTSCLLFVGGAALGQFPHIAYSEMLTKISNSLGAAVIAAPFNTGLDHFELAKYTGNLFNKALNKCRDEFDWQQNTPLYSLAHSLGAKLTLINIAATGIDTDLLGIG